MATRPIFLPNPGSPCDVRVVSVDFKWHPGLSVTQKQKSIDSLHRAAKDALGIGKILEISSKSQEPLGVQLSAFNLRLHVNDRWVSVEAAFQASKVFEGGGPFLDILDKSPREAKQDARLKASGRLTGFEFNGQTWPLTPLTAFYDELYLTALRQNPVLASGLIDYQGFTDIEFNPARSINCQARAAALHAGSTAKPHAADHADVISQKRMRLGIVELPNSLHRTDESGANRD